PHRGARGDPASPARFIRRRHVRLALPGPRRRERRRARGACLVQRTGIKSGGGQLPAAPAPSVPPSPSATAGAALRTERASNCATSTTSSVSGASPELFFAATA